MQKISYKKFAGYDPYKYHDQFSLLKNMNMLPKVILSDIWSPCIWNFGKRLKANFVEAHFLALDFDEPGEETLEELNQGLQDHKRIIATTKSHQKEKAGLICDRFRLIIPFDKPITDLKTYEYNIQLALKRYSWADSSAKDAARFFYPSKEILYCDTQSEYLWEVKDFPTRIVPEFFHQETPHGQIPNWVLRFINDGDLGPGNSRNCRVYACIVSLLKQGFSEEKIVNLIKRAPIEWHGVNLSAALKSARGSHI